MVHPLYGIEVVADVGTACWQSSGHYVMPSRKDGVPYSLKLRNSSRDRVSAKVEIDGQTVGHFVVPALDVIRIERPADSARRFTFFVGGTKASYDAGYQEGKRNNGLIQVTFTPEQRKIVLEKANFRGAMDLGKQDYAGYDDEEDDDCCYDMFDDSRGYCPPPKHKKGAQRYREGVTGLTGSSSQRFTTVHMELDYSRSEVLSVRLVAADSAPPPKVEPLPGKVRTVAPVHVPPHPLDM